MIHHMQALISAAGKKSYILAMGNFHEEKSIFSPLQIHKSNVGMQRFHLRQRRRNIHTCIQQKQNQRGKSTKGKLGLIKPERSIIRPYNQANEITKKMKERSLQQT
ncbi:hypothetical protein YC2023_062975 [Brassica napus]